MARCKDAQAIVKSGTSSGAVYMAGYILETWLKAYWVAQGWKIPSGSQGHNLLDLWKKTELPRTHGDAATIHDLFLHHWSPNLRYCPDYPFSVPKEEMVKVAIQIGQRIDGAIKKLDRRSRC